MNIFHGHKHTIKTLYTVDYVIFGLLFRNKTRNEVNIPTDYDYRNSKVI